MKSFDECAFDWCELTFEECERILNLDVKRAMKQKRRDSVMGKAPSVYNHHQYCDIGCGDGGYALFVQSPTGKLFHCFYSAAHNVETNAEEFIDRLVNGGASYRAKEATDETR